MSGTTMADVILRSTILDLQDSLFLAKELEAAGFGLVAEAKAQGLDEAGDRFDVRSETLLKTMQNMAGHPDTSADDVVRYGAYSAEAQTTGIWLHARAAGLRGKP